MESSYEQQSRQKIKWSTYLTAILLLSTFGSHMITADADSQLRNTNQTRELKYVPQKCGYNANTATRRFWPGK